MSIGLLIGKKKKVEIYNLDYDENQEAQYFLWKTITEENKEELKIVHFPNIKITFEDLFAEIDIQRGGGENLQQN